MRYLVQLFADDTIMPEPGDPAWATGMAGYQAFAVLAGERILAGEPLDRTALIRTVRHDGGAVRVTDGPFAEAVEGLGGYYVLEAPTLDDVLEMVRHIPVVLVGGAEVRPLAEWTDAGSPPAAAGAVRWFVTIHGTETEAETPGSPGWEAGGEAHAQFGRKAGDALLAGGAVHPTSTASVVRVRDGELLVTDGAYPGVSELVGGFYVLRATPDAIADLAAAIPVPEAGAVEIHSILELGPMATTS